MQMPYFQTFCSYPLCTVEVAVPVLLQFELTINAMNASSYSRAKRPAIPMPVPMHIDTTPRS